MSVSLSEDQLKRATSEIDILTYDYPASSDPKHEKKIEAIKKKIKEDDAKKGNPDRAILKYELDYFEKLQKAQKTSVSKDDIKNKSTEIKNKLESEFKSIKKEFDDFLLNTNIFDAIINLDIEKLNKYAGKIFNLIKNIFF